MAKTTSGTVHDPPPARGRESHTFVDVVRSQRATRAFRSEDVPLNQLLACLELAVCAPSGSNQQAWAFVLVSDTKTKELIAASNRSAAAQYVTNPDSPAPLRQSVATAARDFAKAPWIVVPCYRISAQQLPHPMAAAQYGSIFPAIQNFLLACQSVGLGACLTTMALHDADALIQALELSEGYAPCAIIPVGWPKQRLAPPARRRVVDVTFLNSMRHRVTADDVPTTRET